MEIRGTLGQGSNFAPAGIGLCSSKSISLHFQEPRAEEALTRLGSVTVPPACYVDDINAMPRGVSGLNEVCRRIREAMEEISLSTHPDKTEVVVMGKSKKAEEMRNKLKNDPVRMQGKPVKISPEGMYLGMWISQDGHRASVDSSVKHRISKAWGRVSKIKSSINDARM